MAVTRSEKWVAPVRGTHTSWSAITTQIPEGIFCIVTDRRFTGSVEYFIGTGTSTYAQLVEAGALHGYEYIDRRGAASGLASLDIRTKILYSELPITVATTSPTSSDGSDGDFWLVVEE